VTAGQHAPTRRRAAASHRPTGSCRPTAGWRPTGGSQARAGDGGSLSLELALLAPALLAMLALIVSYGRFGSVSGLLETASRDGARAATQSRSLAQAQSRVAGIASDTLAAAPRSCRDSALARLTSGEFVPGSMVTVEVSCTVSFSDLGAWGTPGATTVTRAFTSPLDPNRGVEP
jgi:hypothetical protein